MNGNWHKAEVPPDDYSMMEIAAISPQAEPPYVLLSHAWYNSDTKHWVRKCGETWEIEYWRYSEQSLFDWLGANGLL